MRVKKTKIITIPKLISSVKCGYEETFSDGNAEMVDFVVPEDFKDNISGYFAADASGDSMYPIIFDGDTVVIDKNYNVRSGAIAAAFHEGNLTIKRYIQRGFSHFLVPENKKYEEIKIDENTQIVGCVVTLRRDLKI